MNNGLESGSVENIYTPYHVHTDYSILDSCSKYTDYVDRACEENMKAICFTEHGKPLNWVEKKMYCDSKGIKYIHGVEFYLTESLTNKVRDNYHTVLMAKNEDGVREINELVSLSSLEDHFYYTNRISFDEFLNISDNIISTSACLASPLNKLDKENPYYMRLANKYSYFEIQPHVSEDQARFNKELYELSKITRTPLIAGTDTHSVNAYKAECRDILLIYKHKKYDDDDFDLTWKTYDELVEINAQTFAVSKVSA